MKYLKVLFLVLGLTTLSVGLFTPQAEAYCYWRHGVRYCNAHHPYHPYHAHRHCYRGAHGHVHCH